MRTFWKSFPALGAVLALGGSVHADDCDNDGIDDAIAIANGDVQDCNNNGVPDSCDLYVFYTSYDFDDSGTPDECDIADGLYPDCNGNGLFDWVDIFGAYDLLGNFVGGASTDCDNNGNPDECDPDCNANGVVDSCEIRTGNATDCDGNGVPDDCDALAGIPDCNANTVNDACDIRPTLAFDSATYGFTQVGVIPPIDIKAGDVNGDGLIDLVTANRSTFNPWSMGVFINQGGGIFAPGVIYGPGVGAEALTLGDFDGDGDLDVALCDRNISTYYVAVWRNNGAGVFSSWQTLNAGQVPIDVTNGDIDNDGDLDLVVADINGGKVAIFKNNGVGVFGAATLVAVGSRPLSVTLSDFDHDGDLDLAVSAQTDAAIKVLLNDGSGVFGAPAVYPMGSYYSPTGAEAVDLNSDGAPDLAIELQYSHNVGVLLNNGNGTFAPVIGYGPVAGNPVAITSGDYDGDGLADVAITLSPPWPDGVVSIFRGNGDGTLRMPTSFFAGYSALSLTTADFDADGRDDLATGVYQELLVRVYLNRAQPAYSPDANADQVPDECDCFGDINGDRVIDLSDLALLLSNYGLSVGYSLGNLDHGGTVDLADLAAMLSVYGHVCPA